MNRLLIRLLGPIFAKEMVEMARRKRHYLNRACYGLALLFVLFIIWEEYRWRMASPRELHRVAEALFLAVSLVQYLAVFVLVPLFLAGVIAGEREEHTLELLFTTQLRDREILLGKLASRLVVLVLLFLSGLPVVALIGLFGGVDALMVLRSMAATLLAMLFVAAHAIYFSAATPGTLGALVRTFWWLALLLIGLPIVLTLLLLPLLIGQDDIYLAYGMLMTNPIMVYISALEPHTLEYIENRMGSGAFPLAFALPTAWSVLLIHWAVRRLREPPRPGWLSQFLARLRRVTTGQFDKHPLLGNRFQISNGNPLWQRARRTRVYDRHGYVGRIQWAGWIVAFGFFFLLASVEPRAILDDDCAIAFLSVTWIALAALTVIFAGSSLIGDRRRGFLDQVLVTPLDGRAIVDGTLGAVWQHMLRSFWLPLALGVAFLAGGAVTAGSLVCSLITGYLVCALLALHGVACSLSARTMPGALVPSFVFPIFLTMGVPLLLLWTHEDSHGLLILGSLGLLLLGSLLLLSGRLNPATITCFFLGLHLTAVSLLTFWASSPRATRQFHMEAVNPAFWIIDPLSKGWRVDGALYYCTLFCYWIATLISLLLMYAWLVWRFDQLVGRSGSSKRLKRSSHPSADLLP